LARPHLSYEGVSAARGGNNASGIRSIGQGFSEKKDHLRQIGFFHQSVGPNGFNQGFSVNYGTSVAQQFDQHINRFGRQRDDFTATIDGTVPTSYPVSAKFVHPFAPAQRLLSAAVVIVHRGGKN
jgi:hypothetical protein